LEDVVTTPATVSPAPATAETPAERATRFHAALGKLPASLFQFDGRIAEGWFSDRYFLRTAAALAQAGRSPIVTMQVFAKQSGVLAGIHESLRVLQTQLVTDPVTGNPGRIEDLTIHTLMDGDRIEPWESVMHIQGPYLAFAHLETVYLGVLARRTLVASNVARAIAAARGKPVIFMAARHDDPRVQTPDGYAARIGGAGAVSSNANGAWWGADGQGTMPHALIGAFQGDVVAATIHFTHYVRQHEPTVKVVSLIDYHNDVIRDGLAVARAMQSRFGEGVLHAVRVDTSEKLVDVSLTGVVPEPNEKLTGVNPRLIRLLRAALDAEGFHSVGIVVSGGFTPAKITAFESAGVPVTAYGIGSSLLGHNRGESDGLLSAFDFTADIVMVDGAPESKVGRELRWNPRFVEVRPESLAAD
jgi:nicotinate phosphoribosyltransferase